MSASLSLILLTVLLFAAIACSLDENQAQERDTLTCYGDGSKAVIGGVKEVTVFNPDCPSCTHPQLCPKDSNICFRLSTSLMHVFQGPTLQSSLPILTGCLPLRITEFEPSYEYIIHCAALPPLYAPKQVYAFRLDLEDNFQLEEEAIESFYPIGQGLEFAPIPENSRTVIIDSERFPITLLQNSNLLVQSNNNLEYIVNVTDCSSVHSFITGPLVDDNIQLVIDCNSTTGTNIRRRVLIPDNLRDQREYTVEVLPDPLPGDVVFFSPEGTYLVYRATSSLSLIPAAQLTATPANLHFSEGPIAQVEFLTENKLLVSLPGARRTLVDVQQFFESGFENGVSELPHSTAVCSLGVCPPVVSKNNTLYLFSADPKNPSYQILSAYNVSDPSASPDRISRLLRTAKYDTCFPVRADITEIDDNPPSQEDEPSPDPLPVPFTTPPTTSSTLPPVTTLETLPIGGIERDSNPQSLSEGTIAGIVVGVLAGIFIPFIVIIVILFLCIYFSRHQSKKMKSSRSIKAPCTEDNDTISNIELNGSRDLFNVPEQEERKNFKEVPPCGRNTQQRT